MPHIQSWEFTIILSKWRQTRLDARDDVWGHLEATAPRSRSRNLPANASYLLQAQTPPVLFLLQIPPAAQGRRPSKFSWKQVSGTLLKWTLSIILETPPYIKDSCCSVIVHSSSLGIGVHILQLCWNIDFLTLYDHSFRFVSSALFLRSNRSNNNNIFRWIPLLIKSKHSFLNSCILASQSGAISRLGFRDSHLIPSVCPTYSGDLKQTKGDQCRPMQKSSDKGRARYSRAQPGTARYSQVQTKCWKDPWCATFSKSWRFKDTKYDTDTECGFP